MIRTSLDNATHVVPKLVLRRESVRTLGDSELVTVGGAKGPNCLDETFQLSGCAPAGNGQPPPTK